MKFRFARHTNNLEQLKSFYITVLGLDLLGDFKNHDGYDGIFLGKPNSDWHLEFTQTSEIVDHSFEDDDILVFYPTNVLEFNLISERLVKNKIKFIEAKNLYWYENGKMFLDPDGYRIVISHLKIEL